LDDILGVVEKYKINGFICSNLTKNRSNKRIIDTSVPEDGGISGKVVEKLSNDAISYIYKKTEGKYLIIGLGGVFNAKDAYRKIKKGASLIQLITGMIFEGPQVISEINQGLVKLMEKDGYGNISEAVGADFRC
jgi:dihydroorotate dehydrogenase